MILLKSKMTKFVIGKTLPMKKKPVVFTLVAVVVLAFACAAIFLYERSRVALVIDDEAAWDLRDDSPHKKVIITNDGIVARYISEDKTSYFGDIQDDFTVLKKDARVETWYACDGKGNVLLSEPGTELVYAAPDSLSEVIGKLEHIKGDCPESYLVAGYRDGWFAIEMNGNIGYIREEYVSWDAIDTN